MALSGLIRVAEQQSGLLTQYSLTVPDGQIDALEELNSIYVENLATIRSTIEKHTEFLEQGCRLILDTAKTVLEKLREGQLQFGLTPRKSYEAIYISRPARDSESSAQRLRKNKLYERALKIQDLGCDGAIVVACAMTTSKWAYMTTALEFKYILKNIPKPRHECWPSLLGILDAWENEQPLADCATFKDSLKALRARSYEESVGEPALPTAVGHRNIRYAFSNVPFDKISTINEKLLDAIMRSRQLEMEKQRGLLSSSCVTIFIPDDEQQDGSINVVIQRDAGFEMRHDLALETLTLS